MKISGSVAIITGASRGLGRCFAETLLARGGKVCLADIAVEAGKVTETELQANHGVDNVFFAKCDVTKDEDFKNVWAATTEKLGPVTLLINNAGIGNEKNWQLTLDVNIGGCMRGTTLGLEKMGVNKEGSGGVIVNIASIAGLKVVPFGPVYAATKHAIVGLTRSLGHPFHYNQTKVKVHALCPSLVSTDLLTNSKETAFSPQCVAAMAKVTAAVKLMTPETVAEGLLKLLEEEAPTGGCLVVEAEKEPYYVDPPITS